MIDLGVATRITSTGVEGWQRKLVENARELPELLRAKSLYLDVETNSFDRRRGGNYAQGGDRIAGVAVTADDAPCAWYVPVRHTDGSQNIDLDAFRAWLADVVGTCEDWVNHNISMDAHFAAADGARFNGRLVCTLALSKLVDTDRLQGHDLKGLGRDWLGWDTSPQDRVQAWLDGAKTENFADCPADIMGTYACDDVLMNRALHKHVWQRIPGDMSRTRDLEIAVTPVLFDMEQAGMRFDPRKVLLQKRDCLKAMIEAADKIQELTGVEYVNSNDCAYEIMVNQLGLPVLSWGNERKDGTRGPSFDKDTLNNYAVMHEVASDPVASAVVASIKKYRKRSQFKSLFLESFERFRTEAGFIHPSYNQIIRTGGRCSSRRPNGQQFDTGAKDLIEPEDERAFICYDASQIEFRIAAHYMNDQRIIARYNEDPKTDYHTWVAQLCEIERDPAKNVNFAMAYGAGRPKIMAMLETDPSIMKLVGERIDFLISEGRMKPKDRADAYRAACRSRANRVWEKYHEVLPRLKAVSDAAQLACEKRGFVRNAYGRRRHLPYDFSRKAFNSAVQGTAGEFVKNRMVALAPRYCEWTRELGIRIIAQVHDELLFDAPAEVAANPEVRARLAQELSVQDPVRFRVPFLWVGGWSTKSWAEAKRKSKAA